MTTYPELSALNARVTGDAAQRVLLEQIVPHLVRIRLDDYRRHTASNDIVENWQRHTALCTIP